MCSYISPVLSKQKEYFATMEVNQWPWPARRMRKPRNGLTWFNIIWVSVFQYCFIRVATTIVSTATQATGHYCKDSLHPAFAHFWVAFLDSLAVVLAMYMLIAFYLNLRVTLAPRRPLLKLLCIKLVIFMCYWQKLIFDVLSSARIVRPTKKISVGDISIGFNALLVCFEMIIFSIMHLFAYPWSEYQSSDLGSAVIVPAPPLWKPLLDVFNPSDIVRASARGAKWVTWGYRSRHREAEKVAARGSAPKASGGDPTQAGEDVGLVANAAAAGAPGGWAPPLPPASGPLPDVRPGPGPHPYLGGPSPGPESRPGPGVYGGRMSAGGLVIEHPTPGDQEHVPGEEPAYGFATTEHTGYQHPPVEMASSPMGPDVRTHYTPPPTSPLLERRPSGPTVLPYPDNNSMPSLRDHHQQHQHQQLQDPYRVPSPGERQELLGHLPAMRTPSPWQEQQQQQQQQQGGGSYTYSESMLDEHGIYRGPSPRRGDQLDESGRRWREV